MKRHGNLWEKITHPDNLLLAYKQARKGKGWRMSVKKFEEDIGGNLIQLREMLLTKQYTTSSYAEKIIYEPKKRTIYKLPFYPDRIVQHALLQVVIPIWDSMMIYDSYACRVGKGMHEASRKTMNHARHFKYCLQADISKFYPSIDHNILMEIISRKIKCKDTLNLLEDIIRSFPGGKNTPIGNYTSQWFGNLYMNELDQFIKHKYHIHEYLRYCDDFVIFSDDKKMLHNLKDDIENFVKDKLMMKFSRWSIYPVTQGVDFLGYRHFPNKILLRKSTAKRVIKRMELLPELLSSGKITLNQYRSSIASTEGWIKWADTYNLKTKLQINILKEALQMKGFPKQLNSYNDILNLKESHPKELKIYLQDILNNKDQWLMTSKLDLTDIGLVSDIFKVIENIDIDTKEITERYQYEYKEDPNCFIFKLGFNTTSQAQEFVDKL